MTARVHGLAQADLRVALEPLLASSIAVVVQDERAAWRAAELRRRHDDRRSCALSLADCLLLAAVGDDDALATADPAVCEAARREGLGVLPLPDAAGVRP